MAARTLSMDRMVQWSDSDPAGHINAPRAFDMATEAIEAFFRRELGISYLNLIHDLGMGAPFVRAECDYHARVMEGESVTMRLAIDRLGRSTVTWRVDAAHHDGGHPAFTVRMVQAIIDMKTARAIAIPDDFRTKMELYVDAAVEGAAG